MSGVIKQKVKWIDPEYVDLAMKESDSMSKEDAQKAVKALIKKQETFLNEAKSLYLQASTSELYSVVTISENIIRELAKLE
jgi:hypothetical protein